MSAAVVNPHWVKRSGLVQVPTVGVAAFGERHVVVAVPADPLSRRCALGPSLDQLPQPGDGRDGLGSAVQSAHRGSLRQHMAMRVDQTWDQRHSLAVDGPGATFRLRGCLGTVADRRDEASPDRDGAGGGHRPVHCQDPGVDQQKVLHLAAKVIGSTGVCHSRRLVRRGISLLWWALPA